MADHWPLLLLTAATGAFVVTHLLRAARSLRLRARAARGAAAEPAAAALARRRGYRVLATQVAGQLTVRVDGQPETAGLRADLLLERGGRRFIGEVKTGRAAPDPLQSATRRQLLEYAVAFDADGLLLFDMEAGRIREIEFGTRLRRSGLRPAGALFFVALGAALEPAHHLIRAWLDGLG